MFDDSQEYDNVIGLLEDSLNNHYSNDKDFNYVISDYKFILFERLKILGNTVRERDKKNGVEPGRSYESIILAKLYNTLVGCNSPLNLKAAMPDLKIDLLRARTIDLDFKADKFSKSHRGKDALGKILVEILKSMGKGTPATIILKELQKVVSSGEPNKVIDIIDQNGTIYWFSRGKTNKTEFRSLENRLTRIRKEL